MEQFITNGLLGSDDPEPVEMINKNSSYPVLIVCEHAGRAIPKNLGSLGLDQDALEKHIAWDIGAGALARNLTEMLGATAILQRYSRLVIDCNRPVIAPDSMPPVSDGIAIPGNADLRETDRQARIDEIFLPFHRLVDAVLDEGRFKAAVSIHSFTPMMDGFARPWDIGFLYRKDVVTSQRLASSVARSNPDLFVGFNQPYQIDDESDWFVPQHGERRNLPHSLIEIRNDHLSDDQAVASWVELLAAAIDAVVETL